MSEIDPNLSRAYRAASGEQPPAALDAAILAAAHEQAEAAKRQRTGRSSWWSWMAPASAIATLVVGVSIALLVEREQPATLDASSARPASPKPQSAVPAPAMDAAKAKAAAAPAQLMKEEAAGANLAPLAQAPAPARMATPAARPPVPARRLDAPAPPAAQAFPAGGSEKAIESAQSLPEAAAKTGASRDSMQTPAAAAPAAAGRLAPSQQQAVRSPEAWLEDIARLERQGRVKEAAEQLAEFRKAYPAYAAPEDLLRK